MVLVHSSNPDVQGDEYQDAMSRGAQSEQEDMYWNLTRFKRELDSRGQSLCFPPVGLDSVLADSQACRLRRCLSASSRWW